MFNQLEFFEKSNEEKLKEEIIKLNAKCENLRKSYYANDNKRKKQIDDLNHKMDTMIVAMCKNQDYKTCYII